MWRKWESGASHRRPPPGAVRIVIVIHNQPDDVRCRYHILQYSILQKTVKHLWIPIDLVRTYHAVDADCLTGLWITFVVKREAILVVNTP